VAGQGGDLAVKRRPPILVLAVDWRQGLDPRPRETDPDVVDPELGDPGEVLAALGWLQLAELLKVDPVVVAVHPPVRRLG
jgi:hypothetical protein